MAEATAGERLIAALGDGRIICSECQATLDTVQQTCLYSTGECPGYLAITAARTGSVHPEAIAEWDRIRPTASVVDIATRQPKPPERDPLDAEVVDASAVSYSEEPLQWVVDDLIPIGSVCLFSGGKGLGKSRLLVDLLTAAALGQPWLGRTVGARSGFGMFCEDSDRTIGIGQQVLEGRLARCLQARGAEFEDLENRLHWRSGTGRLSYIWESNRNTSAARPTELWKRLEARLDEYGTQILVLDTRSHVYNGNTNDNYSATVFLNWLTKWAAKHAGCVILTCHPPKDRSARWAGCEEWSAVPRAHLHLDRPKHYDPDSGTGKNERVLVREKGNENDETPLEIPIVWDKQGGLFILDEGTSTAPTEHSFFGKPEFDMQVLRAVRSLMEDGAQVYALHTERQSLVKLVATLPGFQRASKQALISAGDRLLQRGDLVRVKVGTKVLLRPADRKYGGEDNA